MEQQAISQTQAPTKVLVDKKIERVKSVNFYQLLAELTLQQKRQRAQLRG